MFRLNGMPFFIFAKQICTVAENSYLCLKLTLHNRNSLKDCSNVTQRLIDELQARDRKGFAKYGTTLDRTDLNRLEWLQHAKEEALDFACYLEKLIVMEQSGENTATLSKSPLPLFSNAKELTDKGSGQEAYNLLAASLLGYHRAFEANEIRRTWMTLHQLEDGATLCAIIKNAIETAQGIEYMKPDGDPVGKLKTIQYVGKGNPDVLQTLFEACGHKVSFMDVTDQAQFKEANRKAGTGEPE